MKLRILLLFVFLVNLPFLTSYGQKSVKGKDKITISGTVSGIDKSPVTGAYIFIDSLVTGSTSDDRGKFKIKVSRDAKEIFVVSPDHGYAEKAIDGLPTIDLVLDSRKNDLPGFAARYIAETESSKSSSKSAKIKKVNTYTDIYMMIRQEVHGVLVSGRSIVIQQPNSFYGSTTPLFVVNGVRVPSIDNINPQEVKDIKLLTGSSANIYGNEGANGVISITLISGADK